MIKAAIKTLRRRLSDSSAKSFVQPLRRTTSGSFHGRPVREETYTVPVGSSIVDFGFDPLKSSGLITWDDDDVSSPGSVQSCIIDHRFFPPRPHEDLVLPSAREQALTLLTMIIEERVNASPIPEEIATLSPSVAGTVTSSPSGVDILNFPSIMDRKPVSEHDVAVLAKAMFDVKSLYQAKQLALSVERLTVHHMDFPYPTVEEQTDVMEALTGLRKSANDLVIQKGGYLLLQEFNSGIVNHDFRVKLPSNAAQEYTSAVSLWDYLARLSTLLSLAGYTIPQVAAFLAHVSVIKNPDHIRYLLSYL